MAASATEVAEATSTKAGAKKTTAKKTTAKRGTGEAADGRATDAAADGKATGGKARATAADKKATRQKAADADAPSDASADETTSGEMTPGEINAGTTPGEKSGNGEEPIAQPEGSSPEPRPRRTRSRKRAADAPDAGSGEVPSAEAGSPAPAEPAGGEADAESPADAPADAATGSPTLDPGALAIPETGTGATTSTTSAAAARRKAARGAAKTLSADPGAPTSGPAGESGPASAAASPPSQPGLWEPASRPAPPRLATTALLFQAPDPSAAPRRARRAQAPAGPPIPATGEAAQSAAPAATAPAATAPAATAPAGSTPALAISAASPSATPTAATSPAATPPSGRGTRKRARTSSASRPADEPMLELTVEFMSAEERAAVEEIELIESELAGEAIEPVEPTGAFTAADFRAETPDGELVEPESAAEDFAGADVAGAEIAEIDLADINLADADSDEEPGEDGVDLGLDADGESAPRRRRRRGGRGRRREPGREPTDEPAEAEAVESDEDEASAEEDGSGSSRRRRRRRRGGAGDGGDSRRVRERPPADEVMALKGSTRLEAKRQRRREGRDAGRRRQIITEAEFLARRESVTRTMVVRERAGRIQIAVLEDGVLVEHYVSQQSQVSMAGNVYLGRVQNVLPSMEAAFIDVGKGRNAVLYAGEVNWDAAGLEGQPRRIEQALKSGDSVLVQVTKDPIGHKGARLTSQVTLAGRYLVLVPGGGMTGISRKLPENERTRLKRILRDIVPDDSGVIVRTAAEGASEDELRADIERLSGQWAAIEKKARTASAPALLQGEPDLAIRVVRDIFNDDFSALVVQGDGAWRDISGYVAELAPDLRERVSHWTSETDVFTVHRVDEQLAKGMDRKVWLPSGGSLVIDRTEAMTVVDVNTGKFTGSGGTLEETVTRNNLEAAEEIVRQLRLRDIGGIIVIDFIDMVLESNRDLVLRRLVECLGRDRTKHQVAEVTSLGLVQMTRKRVGQGLVEAFSETCEHCHGRGFVVHNEPVERSGQGGAGGGGAPDADGDGASGGSRRSGRRKRAAGKEPAPVPPQASTEAREAVKATLATIAAAAAHAHDHREEPGDGATSAGQPAGDVAPAGEVGVVAEPGA